jgi:hypothetical protein
MRAFPAMRSAFALVLAVSLSLAACGGDSPSSPTPPQESGAPITGVSLSTLDYVRLNLQLRLVLTATLSDGTTRVVQGTWQSSHQAVATVASDGLVTGVSVGNVTISAEHQSHRAERRLRVVPDYAGDWVGAYRVIECVDSGDWEGACEDEDLTLEWDLAVTLVQSGADVIGAIAAFENLAIPVTGVIGTSGRLGVAGELDIGTPLEPYLIAIVDWDTLAVDRNRRMVGRFQIVSTASDLEGEYRNTCEVTELNRLTSTTLRLDSVRHRRAIAMRRTTR